MGAEEEEVGRRREKEPRKGGGTRRKERKGRGRWKRRVFQKLCSAVALSLHPRRASELPQLHGTQQDTWPPAGRFP